MRQCSSKTCSKKTTLWNRWKPKAILLRFGWMDVCMISWASKAPALILFISCIYLNMKMHNWSSTLGRKLLHLSHWGGLKWRLQYHPRHPTNERRTSLLTSPFWNNEVKLFRGLSCEWFLQTVSNKWFGRLWLVNVKTFNDDSLLRIFVDDYLSVPLSLWVFWCL